MVDVFWYDPRYNMSLFWDNLNTGYSGYDISTILTNQSMAMWKPQLTFPDAASIVVSSEVSTYRHQLLLPF